MVKASTKLTPPMVQIFNIAPTTRRAVIEGLAEPPVPPVEFVRGQPVVPENHPLHRIEPVSPSSVSTAVSPLREPGLAQDGFVPDTLQLVGGLAELEADLRDYCVALDFDLVSEGGESPGGRIPELLGTPFVTPLPRFATAVPDTINTYPGFPVIAFGPRSSSAVEVTEDDITELDDMANLQLAVLGSAATGRWDGSQGPGYWRKRPNMKEAVAAQLRTRGGNMQAADQLGVLENQVEPTSGAFDWLQQVKKYLATEITAASRDQFPAATLTTELAEVALGHLATDASYLVKLRDTLAEALPLAHIATAGDYTPSRASGMLVPVQRPTAVALSVADQSAKSDLEAMLTLTGSDQVMLGEIHQVEQESLQRLTRELSEARTALTEKQGLRAEAGEEDDIAALDADVVAATVDVNRLTTERSEAEERFKDISKQHRQVLATKLQIMQQLKQYEPVQQSRTTSEVVKAFMHPTLGRLCTAHDCVLLKVFALMDVAYGIGTALQQVKFSELRQGKGVGVSAEEGVREFAARVRMHVQSSLDLDPKLAHVQFFAGLADPVMAATAKAAMQCDKAVAMNLETATEQVLLIESRELEDLKLRAANGDAAASAELKRRAAAGNKKQAKDAKTAPEPTKALSKPVRAFNPDPNHPEGKCRLPGHDIKKGHMNKDCYKGGSANTPYAVATVAAALPAMYPASSSVPYANAAGLAASLASVKTADPVLQAWQHANALQATQIGVLQEQLANALKGSQSWGQGGRSAVANAHPTSAGIKCNICGFPNGHPSGFCYYEYPEKNPTWAPTTNAKPELVAHWTQRRQQRNLPPLPLRQVSSRSGPVVNNIQPVMSALPPPPVLPMLPAPPVPSDPAVNVVRLANSGIVPTLSAVARLAFPITSVTTIPSSVIAIPSSSLNVFEPTSVVGAVMPRSFLQLPPKGSLIVPPTPPSTPKDSTANSSPLSPMSNGALQSAQDGSEAVLPSAESEGAMKSACAANNEGETGQGSDLSETDDEVIMLEGLRSKVKYVDEKEKGLVVQAPTKEQIEAMLVELECATQLVPCLDTFINASSACGISMHLPDGRWQLPSMVITDSGATFGVTFEEPCAGIGLNHSSSAAITLVLADGKNVPIVGITEPVRLVLAKGTPYERAILYRFLVLPGKGQHYNWLIAKNALLELGAYVDPMESAFFYRTQAGAGSPKHSLPVRCSIPMHDADPADCLHVLQPVVAILLPSNRLAAVAAGRLCV